MQHICDARPRHLPRKRPRVVAGSLPDLLVAAAKTLSLVACIPPEEPEEECLEEQAQAAPPVSLAPGSLPDILQRFSASWARTEPTAGEEMRPNGEVWKRCSHTPPLPSARRIHAAHSASTLH